MTNRPRIHPAEFGLLGLLIILATLAYYTAAQA